MKKIIRFIVDGLYFDSIILMICIYLRTCYNLEPGMKLIPFMIVSIIYFVIFLVVTYPLYWLSFKYENENSTR